MMSTRNLAMLARCLIVAAAGLVTACSTVESQSFREPERTVVESAQVATDADFSRYDRLHAVDMGVFSPASAATPAEDVARIRQIFRDTFLGVVEDYEIVTEPAAGAMTVQATLIDFRNASNNDRMSVASSIRDMAAPGKIVFLMEMLDSQTGKVLARAADSARTPAIADEEGETTDWVSVENAALHWARLFRQFIINNLGK